MHSSTDPTRCSREPPRKTSGGRQAAALAIGMINGLGSVGAVSQEFITRTVSGSFGWNGVFYVLLASAIASALLLAPTFRTTRRHVAP